MHMRKNKTLSFKERVAFLKGKAKEIRVNVVKMIHKAQSGHPGVALLIKQVLLSIST